MKFITYHFQDSQGIALDVDGAYLGLTADDPYYPGTTNELIAAGGDSLAIAAELLRRHGAPVDLAAVHLLPPVAPGRIMCVGLNYADHAAETGLAMPQVPTIFSRFATSVVGPEAALHRPGVSDQFDFEGELAVVIGGAGRHIAIDRALDHVAGYCCFNDGSVRDYQLRTPQWMIGKNFDRSGSLGPALVTVDALPPGARGLAISTRLNGMTVQSSSTAELIFDVARLVALLSEAFTLEPGDIIATGTPSGVGLARTPPLWMKPGDICEVEIEGLGILRNGVVAE